MLDYGGLQAFFTNNAVIFFIIAYLLADFAIRMYATTNLQKEIAKEDRHFSYLCVLIKEKWTKTIKKFHWAKEKNANTSKAQERKLAPSFFKQKLFHLVQFE